jgi:hypothetical protein
MARITDEVSGLHLHVGEDVHKAELENGIAVFWLPAG